LPFKEGFVRKMMGVRAVYLVPVIALGIFAMGKKSLASGGGFFSLGFRGGTSFLVTRIRFSTYEVFGVYKLPYDVKLGEVDVQARWNFAGGVVRQDEDSAFLLTFGPGLAFNREGLPLILDGGVGLGFISEPELGERDFGAPLQFTAHGGIGFRVGHLYIGYRFHHMSDMGFFDGKGMNRNLLELGYAF
jgi:hypothetical protein